MRVLVSMMKHETNTFSPIRADLARFRSWGLHEGPDVIKAYEKAAMPISAFIAWARSRDAEIVSPLAAEAMPGGRVTDDAFEWLAARILDAVSDDLDAILLDLHGAMVTDSFGDGEGELLRRVRTKAPDTPIGVAFDLHANVTQTIARNADVVVGYRTYPHIDMYETGEHVARIIDAAIRGGTRPKTDVRNLPVLAQTLRMGTDDEPMSSLVNQARDIEARDGVHACTLFGGFPLADIHDAGMSVVTVTDDSALAAAVSDELEHSVVEQRAEFVHTQRPLEQTIASVREMRERPVILLDHADNCGSGGTQDVMTVLDAVMRADLGDVVMATVWDPHAAAAMRDAGEGADITLDLGGRTDIPSLNIAGKPLRLSGRVGRVTDGKWRVEGAMYRGVAMDTGITTRFDVGRTRIVVTSHHHEPWDTGIFTLVGIDPADADIILLKSRIHFRAAFAPISTAIVPLDGVGATTSDNDVLTYRRVRRPIFPLDA